MFICLNEGMFHIEEYMCNIYMFTSSSHGSDNIKCVRVMGMIYAKGLMCVDDVYAILAC